ncbi:ESF1 (predicted) [Pycnogonum litorale]
MIYPSDYGVARLKEEEISGPKELVSKSDEELGLEEKEEGNKYHMEKLRKYQLNRLKYYYAVVECDSVNTANKLYEECDGLEYETSATRLDLRFIPDDVVFEQEPTSTADELPEFSSYQPTNFTTTALQQVKVDLTWDETNPDRMKTIQKTFDEKEEFGDDIKAYLASSSDENDEDLVNDQSNCSDDKDGNHRSSIAKYKSLLLSIEEKDKKKADDDVEMEVSWEPGLKDTTEKMLGKKEKEKSMTPWDKFLEKKRDKRIQKMENKHRKESSGGEEQPFSDDDIPSDVDLKDNYFKEEFKDDGEKKSKKAREKKGSESVEDKKSKAELELLLMDNDDVEKKHFNMKSIIDKETGSKKRKKKNVKIDDDKDENDTFQVDVKDARFNALYTSHLFNIDPSDQQYKKTRGTDAIVEEKRKRRSNKSTDDVISKQSRTADKEDDGLSTLVRSVKNKAKNYNFKKEKKKIVK